jgi:plastocyanin
MLGSVLRPALLIAALLVTACGPEPEATPSPSGPSPAPVAAPSPSPSPDGSPSPERACTDATVTGAVEVRIAARDFAFNPDCLIVLGGQGLVVRNAGNNLHNFTIQGSPIGFDIPPGEVTRTETVGGAVAPGTYTFSCIYHRAQGMTGELTVSAAG